MISPASETRNKSSIVVGYSAKATAALPSSTRRFQFLAAAHAADEIDSLVGANVFDAEDADQALTILQNADVERGHDVPRGGAIPERQTQMRTNVPPRYIAHCPATLRRVATVFCRRQNSSLHASRNSPLDKSVQIAHAHGCKQVSAPGHPGK